MSQAPRPESPIGRYLHRSFFKVLSLLPKNLRTRLQRSSFDARFKTSRDPWGYQESIYEADKRIALINSLPTTFESLLEVGCADGHNLAGIREVHPSAKLVGLDISSEAIKRAQAQQLKNIEFVEAVPGISAKLQETHGTFEVMVFSEMLYYIGNKAAWKELLTPLGSLLRPGSIVIAVHPASDATLLHDRLCEIMGLEVVRCTQYADQSRPYEIRIATLPKR
jgi:2-polyprenyl-3-methyl-5-hydroxy-6-metoxy-1,4-benzoquinol methylase